MHFRRLRAFVAAYLPGSYFFAVVAMGPLAAVAILLLREVDLAAPTPIWVIPLLLVCGQMLTTLAGAWATRAPSRFRLHAKVVAHVAVVTAVIYATGWGPALAVGLVLIGQETLTSDGIVAQRVVIGWACVGLVVGQVLIALGWAPSLIPVPAVHGLAALVAVGIAFSYHSLRSALVDKERAMRATEQQEHKFRALLQSSHDLVFVFDAAANVTYASPSCRQVLGCSPEELLGPNQAAKIHPDDIDAMRSAMQTAVATEDGRADLLFRLRRADGSWCWVEGVATNLFSDDVVDGVVVNVRDVTERMAAEDAIRHQALHDPLTGLANRALFADRLQHAIERRGCNKGSVAVLIIDLDGFKNINDSLGHAVGDDLLVAVAHRFSFVLRLQETVARLGGDEFAVLIEDLNRVPDEAMDIAQRLLDALQAPFELVQRDVAIGASIGIAIGDNTPNAAQQLLTHADAAMYRAKREGKGCYRLFEDSMLATAIERLELEQDLRNAIAQSEISAHYQPIIDIHCNEVTGFEALVRWNHPRHGLIPPDIFIPIAEESNLILEVGRHVLAQACFHAQQWREAFPDLNLDIAVNISQRQLTDPQFARDVADALNRTGLPPSAVVLEITESTLVNDAGRAIRLLEDLRRAGIRVAIDDFGTGYSSFAALAELPIDILKIDKRFIDNLTKNHQGRGFVNAIIQLARTLDLETIAEGVEHPDQRDALRQLGGTHLQGYIHSRPMTSGETDRYLAQRALVAVASQVGPATDRVPEE
jgi:diguanylate cyclase (GGDEF)-like protein/PAS domain S-box-containing protein